MTSHSLYQIEILVSSNITSLDRLRQLGRSIFKIHHALTPSGVGSDEIPLILEVIVVPSTVERGHIRDLDTDGTDT